MDAEPSKLRATLWSCTIAGFAVLMAGLVGCSEGPESVVPEMGQVEGQIFIVTQGAGNLKLGLVSVQVFDDAGCAKLENKIREYQSGLAFPRLALAEARAKHLQQDKAALEGEMKLLEAKKARLIAGLPDRKEAAELTAQYDRIIEPLRKSLAMLRGGPMDDLEVSLLLEQGYALTDPNSSGGVDPVNALKTDADGRFRFQVAEQGSFALRASGQRTLPDGELERYHWCVKFPAKGGQILLSNDNMISSDGDENLFTQLGTATSAPDTVPEFSSLVGRELKRLRDGVPITADSDALLQLHKEIDGLFQQASDRVTMRVAEEQKQRAEAAAAQAKAEEALRQQSAARAARREKDVGRSFAELRTRSGRILRNVKITKFVDGGIVFGSESGIAKISYDDLNQELRDAYYDQEGVENAMARQEAQARRLREYLQRKDILEGTVLEVNTRKDGGLIGTTMTSQHGTVFVFEYIGKNVGDQVSIVAFPTEKGLDGDGVQVWTLSAERAAGF